ncbi:MAG: trypsin-like peptidase domain-containing protein, partial [Acidimicrobiia bacterium]|nr:trypsin-like peptidase domain-containing protein [Acidimicrobiia bacterium]
MAFVIVAAVTAAILVASGGLVGLARRYRITAPTIAAPGTAAASSVGEAIDPALVDFTTTLGYESAKAAGTGIVLTPSGEILTNHHVVQGATAVSVTDIGNGETYDGKVVGYDVSEDIAVIQLSGASGLKTATIADSSKVSVGDNVVAVGNAGGVGGTPTESPGEITGLDKTITAADDNGSSEQLTGLLQTSAQLISGDSGGPLVDRSARVIGVDTAGSSHFSFRNGNAGGFAIPINRAIEIARQITSGHGSSTVHIGPSAFLGVQIQASDDGSPGADVAGTVSGSPAQRAGLEAGDVITSIGGSSVGSPTDLSAVMQQHHPGDRVRIGRDDGSGRPHTATVTAASGPVA